MHILLLVQYKQQANPLFSLHNYTPFVTRGNHKNSQEILLKVVGNEKGEGWEAGYCSKTVSDSGDRCLFAF